MAFQLSGTIPVACVLLLLQKDLQLIFCVSCVLDDRACSLAICWECSPAQFHRDYLGILRTCRSGGEVSNAGFMLCRYYLLHYTYGMDYNATTGEHMPGKYGEWRFDKRSYAQLPPPRRLDVPPDLVSNEQVLTIPQTHPFIWKSVRQEQDREYKCSL